MLAPSRAARFLAGLSIGLLAIPLALSTPWAKSALLGAATAWARDHYGVDVRAARLDYRLTSLAFSLDDVAVADPAATDRPFLTIAQLDLDLAASALRGRLDFERIRVSRPSVVLDSTTRLSRRAAGQGAPDTTTAIIPAFEIDALEIQDLDLVADDGTGTRVVVRQLTTTLHGRGSQRLDGDVVAAGGVGLSFGTAAIQVAFDRVEARVAVDGGRRTIGGSLSAHSPVAEVHAEGDFPLDAARDLDLRYEVAGQVAQLGRWWPAAPDLRGRATVRGRIRGTQRAPEASFEAASPDVAWSTLAPATLAASGRVSSTGFELDTFALVSPQGAIDGRGRLAFDDAARSALNGQWRNLSSDAAAEVLALPPDAVPPAMVSGSAALSWPGLRPAVHLLEGRLEATASARAPDAAAVGALVADGGNGRWQVGYQQTLDGLTRASLESVVVVDADRLARSTVAGSIDLESQDLHAALLQLQRLGLSLPAVGAALGSERAAFDGTIEGSLGAPRVRGALSASGVRLGDVTDVRVHGTISLDANAFEVSPLTIESDGNQAVIHGTLPWKGAGGEGRFDAHVAQPGRVASMVPLAWRPAGTFDVSGEWRGSAQAPRVTAQLSGTQVTANGLTFESLSGDLELTDRIVRVTRLRATQPHGSLDGTGAWNLEDSTLVADAAGTGLVMSILAPDETGTLVPRARLADVSVDAHVDGAMPRVAGRASLTAGAVEIDGRRLGRIHGRVDAEGGLAHVTAGAPEIGVSADGRVTLDDQRAFEGRLTLDGADVDRLGHLAGLELDGVSVTLDATADTSGTLRHLAAVHAAVALTRLEGQIRERPLRLSQAGRALFEDGVVRIVEPMHLTLGATTLDIAAAGGATPGGGVLVTLDGPLADVTAMVPSAMPEGVAVDGTVRAEVRLEPRLAALAPTGLVTLDVTALRRGDRELARGVKVVAEGDAGTIRVRELTGTVLGSPVEARGTAPMAWVRAATNGAPGVAGEPATFSLRSVVAVGPMLAALTDRPLNITGTVNLALDGSASAPRLDAVQATLVQQAGDVTLSGVALTQQAPTRLRLEQGRLLLEAFEWRGPESTVVASGTVGLADGVDGRLQLKGDASLAMLTLFVPARVSGRARFDVEVSGTAGARALLGTIGIVDGNMVVQPWRVAMADWSGTVEFDRDSIAVTGLRGQFNGGEATIEGRIPVRGDGSAESLAVAIRGAFLELPRGLRSQLDAALEWSHAGGRARLAGNATVTAQAYREPATELARIASMLVDQSGRSPIELPAALAATALDVRLATIGPLAMTNSVARVELMPELQLTGTVGRPALDGQVAVADDGRIQFGGRQYRFRDSRIEFSSERGMVPRLALTGDTRVGDYTVHLRLSGPANEIETSLSSDPPLGERDLQTLLVTGQRETLGRGGDADQMAVGAVSGDVLGFAGQFLGFDSVVVSTTDDLSLVSSDVDPALRLTVSKRLGNRFELVLSDNLDDNELTWVVIYRPRPGFEFRVVSRDNTEFTGEFRQEIPFGPGVSPPRTTARRQVERDRIAAVTISGDPGLTQAEVLAATGLRSGDHFDFGRWLEDRERIAQRYVEHGYFSVRIVPTRRRVEGAADGARVALDYRITRGPRTVLSVEGFSPPPALLEQLRRAWADSALLELLDVDLERVMRQHLVASGYLRATLAVDVDDSTPDLVTATVKVEPGALSSDRRLGFSGNTAISDTELLAVAQARTVVTGVPWLDPEPLLDALESAYAARGYLAAKATAGAIVFSNGSATLPLHVVEGPLARVATLSVDGAERVGEADAAAGTGLTVGATYLAGGEQAARLALERYYRNLGYGDVTVESRTTVNAGEGRVDVAVTVHEGPRYVVQSVRTSGVESTRDALVERATRVEPGAAASPANVEAIRRRLYDLGTFRSAEVTYAPVGAPSTAAIVPVDAVVSLQESRRFLFLYGVEATNQYLSVFDQRVTSAGVAADLRDRNFLGRGWTLGAGARYEPSFWSTRVLASVPRLGSRRIRTNLYADRRSEDRAGTETVTFRDAETAVTLEQRWRPRAPVEFSWGYRFDYRDLQFVSVETGQRLLGFNGYLSSLAGAMVVDRRDSMFDAKRGWLMSTSAEWGLQPLGSDFDYLRTLVRASLYQPVGPLTMASNVRWGHLQSFGGRPPLTALDLFYQAGGTQTVRGYQQDSLSAYELRVPGSSTPVPVGGTSLLVLNEEVRFPLFGRVSGAAFADAGNTFTAERGIVLDDLAVGLGVGLRIRTPLAPVRLDLGFPVPRRPGESGYRWHFSIGQIF